MSITNISKLLVVIIFFFLINIIGKYVELKPDLTSYIDPSLVKEYYEYVEDCKKYRSDCNFKNLHMYEVDFKTITLNSECQPGGCLGIAFGFYHPLHKTQTNRIQILRVVPGQYGGGYFSRKATVYHELSHLFFCQSHVENPLSIMYYTDIGDEVLKNNWNQLVKELFDGTNDKTLPNCRMPSEY